MHFIVAVDGSEYSDRALDYALEITQALEATMTLVHVVEPRVHSLGGETPFGGLAELDERLIVESLETAEARGETLLTDAQDRAERAGVSAETALLYGDAVERLAAYATEAGADGLFVGHRGYSERYARLVGSVAKDLIEVADVPVTVVR